MGDTWASANEQIWHRLLVHCANYNLYCPFRDRFFTNCAMQIDLHSCWQTVASNKPVSTNQLLLDATSIRNEVTSMQAWHRLRCYVTMNCEDHTGQTIRKLFALSDAFTLSTLNVAIQSLDRIMQVVCHKLRVLRTYNTMRLLECSKWLQMTAWSSPLMID